MNDEIKKKLTSWFREIVAEFPWLTVRYEFSENLGTYIVGYYPSVKIDRCEEFCRKAMIFEDDIRKSLGDNAPLFGNEEECFVFSDNAICIPEKSQFRTFINPEYQQGAFYEFPSNPFECDAIFSLAA